MSTATYERTLRTARKANWEIEDILGPDSRLDFTRPFMPESLARVEGGGLRTPAERRLLNQIRGHAYLQIFGLVTNPAGALTLNGTHPNGLPSGANIFYQFWIPDPLGPVGFAASNGMAATMP